MDGQSFRLKSPTLGILSVNGNGHETTVTLPSNAIVKVESSNFDGDRIFVAWEGKTISMFAQDLRTRGVLVDGA